MVMPSTIPGVQPDHTDIPRWGQSRSQAVESMPGFGLSLSGHYPGFGVDFVAPLEVEISQEEDYWAAVAPDIQISGVGDTPRQAFTDFIDVLTDRYRWLDDRTNLGPALQEELSTLTSKLRLL